MLNQTRDINESIGENNSRMKMGDDRDELESRPDSSDQNKATKQPSEVEVPVAIPESKVGVDSSVNKEVGSYSLDEQSPTFGTLRPQLIW